MALLRELLIMQARKLSEYSRSRSRKTGVCPLFKAALDEGVDKEEKAA
jgi:hypothetical protein